MVRLSSFQTESAFLLNNACLLEGFVGTVLGDGLEALGRDGKGEGFIEFRHENAFLLEIGVFAALAARGKFGSANTVGVATAHNRTFPGYCADLCHKIAVGLMVS